MTQIDFYVLPRDGSLPVVNAVGRIAEKAVSRGHHLFVSVCDEEQAHTLDNALWTFRAESFLPHALINDDDKELVSIGWSEPPLEQNDVLINAARQGVERDCDPCLGRCRGRQDIYDNG